MFVPACQVCKPCACQGNAPSMKSYISPTHHLHMENISMGYYGAMKITAGEPPKQKLARKYSRKPPPHGISFASDTVPGDLLKVLAYFPFCSTSILSSLLGVSFSSFQQTRFSFPLLPLPISSSLRPSCSHLPVPSLLAVPVPHAIVQILSLFFISVIENITVIHPFCPHPRLHILSTHLILLDSKYPTLILWNPHLDYSNQDGLSPLSSTEHSSVSSHWVQDKNLTLQLGHEMLQSSPDSRHPTSRLHSLRPQHTLLPPKQALPATLTAAPPVRSFSQSRSQALLSPPQAKLATFLLG